MYKITSAQRRASDDALLLALITSLLDDAHFQFAYDGDSTARLQLFSAGLYREEIERLRARVLRRYPDSSGRSVVQLPTILEVGSRLVEERREREAAKKNGGAS